MQISEIFQAARYAWESVCAWFYAQNWGVIAAVALLLHVVVHAAVAIKCRNAEKRRKAEAKAKRLQYTLPDRDNTFVRARLHTVLQVPEQDEKPLECDTCEKQDEFRFAYARKLLTKLKNAPLSAVERLQAEDMEKTLGVFLQKERLQAEEIRLLSDTFAAVLKLAAKYAV